jgi:Tfp pilus assembly protein PilN
MSSLQTTLKAIDEEQFAYEAKFENLLTETRLSFDYFHRQFPEEKIEKMVIWSDDDKAHGFAQRASKELNVFAKISNPLEDLKVGKGYAVEYAIGYGLALRSLYEFKEDINLSPGFKKIEVEQLLRLAVFEMCLAAAILFMFYTFDTGKVQVLQNEFNQTIKHRSNIDVNIENVSSAQLQKTKQQIQGKLNYLQNLIEGRILLSSKLDRASQLLPKDLWLDKLTYGASKDNTKHVLTLVGYANKAKGDDQIKAINNFLETLKTDSQFSSGIASIKLESISNAKYSDTVEVSSFIISCSME